MVKGITANVGFMKNNKPLLLLSALGLSIVMAGCSVTPSSVGKPAPIASWQGNANSTQLARYTRDAINQHGKGLLQAVPNDIETYCPNYEDASRQERLAFWSGFISSLSHFESNHKSDVWYQERFNDAKGNPVVSRGLLQISIESGNGYGCGLKNQKQLHDPKTNISCGVRILNRWVGQRDQVISDREGWWIFEGSWLGAARYWSPFRSETKKAKIAQATRNQPYCLSKRG